MSDTYKQNNKRIAKNTLMLYIRQIVVIAVGLYTVRVVLNELGVEDYGVYNVVGGVVAMLSFLSGTMASATQRFFSFYLGRNDGAKLKQVFSVNCIIYLLLIGVVFVLLESVGLWFVNNRLEIPIGREDSVRFVFQFSILTFAVQMISAPFMATINAHEDMQIFAYVSIIEALLKLGVVFLLGWITFDKLELYSILFFSATFITTAIYVVICLFKYNECQFKKFHWSREIFKELLGYTSWTLFGQITSTARMQGVTILMNQYFTPIVVASRAIAAQVSSQLTSFSSNFNQSLYPPIIKSYSSGNLDGMYQLVYRGSRITFFLMWVLALPIWIYMEEILTLWLDTVPERAVLFTRLTLVEVLIQSISYPIMTAARAPGKMKIYELVLGIIQIVLFLLVWLVLSLGHPDYSAYYVIIGVNIVMFAVRLIITRGLTGLPLRKFFTNVVLKMGTVAVISLSAFVLLGNYISGNLIHCVIVGMIGTVINCAAMYLFGLNKVERDGVNNMLISKIYR